MVPKQCPFRRPTFWYLVCCATCLGSRDNSKYLTYIPTYIHDLTRISIDCLTPASRLRRSASVWIIVTCTCRSLGDYRHLGGRLKTHIALKIKAVEPIMSLSAWHVWAVGPIMTSAARNCILRRMLLNSHYLLDGLGRYHSVDKVGVTKLKFSAHILANVQS